MGETDRKTRRGRGDNLDGMQYWQIARRRIAN
jgi:hypothetical protein